MDYICVYATGNLRNLSFLEMFNPFATRYMWQMAINSQILVSERILLKYLKILTELTDLVQGSKGEPLVRSYEGHSSG